MYNNRIKITLLALMSVLVLVQCKDDEMGEIPDFSGVFIQKDQLARPIVNVILVPPPNSEQFNTTAPSEQGPIFTPIISGSLAAASPAFANPGDKNFFGQTATEFATFLSTDILTVSTVGPTTFSLDEFTGRTLDDDVMDVQLKLIFGGEDLTENPGLTQDNVDTNDVPFLNSFPYLAPPFR